MKPGDVKYAPLTLANAGTLGFTYTMATSATNTDSMGLRDQLTLGVKKVANEAACDSAGVGYLASVDVLTASGALSAGAIASRTLTAGSQRGRVLPGRAAVGFGRHLPGRHDDRDLHLQRHPVLDQ